MEKIINVNGQDIRFKATASTTRRYRERFNRDLFQDIANLQPSVEKEYLTAGDLEVFENIAYIMARQADPDIPDDPDEWLDQFEMLSIYEVLPQLIELWQMNTFEISETKKKVEEQSGE